MSKAIAGASMIGGAIGIGVLIFFQPELLVAIPFITQAMFAIGLGGVSMEAGAIAGALTSNRGQNITTRTPAGLRQIIYGMQRVGGQIVYQSTSGNQYWQMNMIIVIATHTIDSIQNLYLDGRQVYWRVGSTGNTTRNGVNFGGDSDSNDHIGPGGPHYNFGTLVYCEARFGDQPAGDVIAAVAGNDATWSTAALGNPPSLMGCAYVYLKVVYHSITLPTLPEIRFTVNGKNNIYDPRTGLRGYSQNWALQVADVITDPIWGLGDNTVNQAQLIAAANVCDEQIATSQGYEANYAQSIHYDTSTAPGDVISMMMPSAAGRFSRVGGEWYLWPAYWQGPAFSFDQSALVGTPTWMPNRSFKDLINRINGTYIAPNFPYNVSGNLYDRNGWWNGTTSNNWPFAFQPTNYPQYAQDALHGYAADEWLVEDGGIQLPKELSQRGVLSIVQAQRLAKIHLLRNRWQGTGTFPMSLAAWQMIPTSVFAFTWDALGWANHVLEVTKVDLICAPMPSQSAGKPSDGKEALALSTQVTVCETDITIYEWSIVEELTPYDVPAAPVNQAYMPQPPTVITLVSSVATALVGLDGTVTPRVLLGWNAPLDSYVTQIQVQYKLHSSAIWLDAGAVAVGLFATYVTGVVAGQVYDFRIRSLRFNGATSIWLEYDSYTVSIVLSISGGNMYPVAPAGTLTSQAYSAGTSQITVANFLATFAAAMVACTPSPSILTGLTPSQLYYVYYIDPTFAGGSITPIATQNLADFQNKVGYFFIGSIVTQNYVLRYQPSNFSDVGASSTANPAAAYDNNTATDAVVSSVKGLGASTVNGDCVWGGFPSVTIPSAMTLYVLASASISGGSMSASITAFIGSTPTVLASFVASTAFATYSMTIPAGTNLSTVTVECTVHTVSGVPGTTANVQGFEIYIQ